MSIYPPTGTLEIKDATLKIPVIDLQYTSNTAKIEANSNVVTEFPRSKKLIKYPRVALSTNAGNHSALGSGYTQDGYTVKVSSELNATLTGTKAFTNTSLDNSDTWISDQLKYSSGTPVSVTTNVNKFGQNGEWLEIKLPNKIKLSSTRIFSRRTYVTERNDTADIWASNTGTDGDWVKLTTINFNDTYTDVIPMVAEIDTQNYYSYFAIQITEVGWNGGTYVNIGEWELFGVPEYDPEADGVDVTVKSVPNVPNTDWLEVYYDAKDLADGSTTVNDLKPVGTANNGVANGNLSVSDGAFTFDGSGDYISSTVTTTTGAFTHTFAFWMNVPSSASTTVSLVGFGTNSSDEASAIRFDGTEKLRWYFFGNDIKFTTPNVRDKWVHVIGTYDGGNDSGLTIGNVGVNRKIFINAKETTVIENVSGSAGSDALNLLSTSHAFRVGSDLANGNTLTGKIANVRLFNRVLTTDEIYQLYAYQKEYFGHGVLGMTLKAGRLGIGTSEPKATLDVRGDVHGGCPAFWSVYNSVSKSGSGYVLFNTVRDNCIKNVSLDGTTGKITIRIAGWYILNVHGMSYEISGTTGHNTASVGRFGINDTTFSSYIYTRQPVVAGSGIHENAAGQSVHYLNVGDEVGYKLAGDTNNSFYGDGYSNFSGFLLST